MLVEMSHSTTAELPATPDDTAAQQFLRSELAAAMEFAASADFDAPSALAQERAERVLLLLSGVCRTEEACIDVSACEDGSIEIAATNGSRRYTIDISWSGRLVQIDRKSVV